MSSYLDQSKKISMKFESTYNIFYIREGIWNIFNKMSVILSRARCDTVHQETHCFYWHGLTLILAWICIFFHYKVWDESTYPFPNFNGATRVHISWDVSSVTHVLVFECVSSSELIGSWEISIEF